MPQKINYKIIGQGQPLIFICGFGGSYKIYQKVLNPLAQKHKIFIIDFSFPFEDKNLTTRDFAKLIHLFILENVLKKPVLVGHSFGGAVVMAYGLYYKNYKKILGLNPVGILSLTYPKIFLSLLADKERFLKPSGRKIVSTFIKNLYSHLFWSSRELKLVKKIRFTNKQISKIKNLNLVFSENDCLYPLKKIKELPNSNKIKIVKGTHDWPIFKPEKLKEIIQETCQNS